MWVGSSQVLVSKRERSEKATSLDWSFSECLSVFSLSSVSGPLPMTASTPPCLIGPALGPGLGPQHRACWTHHQLIFLQTLSKPRSPSFPALWAAHRLPE